MTTPPDCIPCFLRQALEAARFATDDPALHDRIVLQALGAVAGMDLSQPPPAAIQTIQRLLRQTTGVEDPYQEAKRRFNRLALQLVPELAADVRRARDPFATAIRFAIAGNVLDLGAKGGLGEADMHAALRRALGEPMAGDIEAFRRAVAAARQILYLADNAGEIVFDRLLVEQLPTGRVTLVVRGAPTINDATREDAQTAGLPGLVEVIDNGSDAPGTILADCSEDFRRRFHAADLIIAKGQGNIETLGDVAADVFFLFKVKCATVAAQVGRPVGSQVLWRSPRQKNGGQSP
jgi:uncharacterized protein with ATP-grasp and redox domains